MGGLEGGHSGVFQTRVPGVGRGKDGRTGVGRGRGTEAEGRAGVGRGKRMRAEGHASAGRGECGRVMRRTCGRRRGACLRT